MRQDFVYNNACVIPDINIFDTHSGYLRTKKSKQKSQRRWHGHKAYLSNHYPSKRIRNRRIHSNNIEFYRPIRKTLNSYIQFLPLRIMVSFNNHSLLNNGKQLERTFLNFVRFQEWSILGSCPGNSVFETLVIRSGSIPTSLRLSKDWDCEGIGLSYERKNLFDAFSESHGFLLTNSSRKSSS